MVPRHVFLSSLAALLLRPGAVSAEGKGLGQTRCYGAGACKTSICPGFDPIYDFCNAQCEWTLTALVECCENPLDSSVSDLYCTQA
ncbi:hypothetical protein BUE80_DR013638 [Diplocarpon rosae]|nr:hypothetical protein BUE80_DR013638 [Diplocarpon rosae]